jgi:hypothetical protein
MATKKEKDALIETLKFTPTTYKIEINGIGGECYMGKVDRKIYDYFSKHKIDIEEYAGSWDSDEFDFVAPNMQPFPPGDPFECCNLLHISGPEMCDSNEIVILSESEEVVWLGNTGLEWLEEQDIETDEWETQIIEEQKAGTIVFWGGFGERGTLFTGKIELTSPFDPTLLKFQYSNADGWYLCNGITYDGKDINNDDSSANGRWTENKWVIAGGEVVYEGILREDIDNQPDEEVVDLMFNDETDSDSVDEVTDWFPRTIDPVRNGLYECYMADDSLPATQMLEWITDNWYDDIVIVDVIKIKQWRGLTSEQF